MFDHRSPSDLIRAHHRAPFVPDMPQDNYPHQVANAYHALRARTEHLASQRDTVRDSLNRRA